MYMPTTSLPYCRQLLLLGILALLGAVLTFGQGLPTSAVVRFGDAGAGSPFPPTSGHDRSAHAADKLVPRTVTIAAGGTVTFLLSNPVHGIGIYAADTGHKDIDTGVVQFLGAPCPPAPYVNDSTNRLASFAPICAGGAAANQYQFNQPGRYLVICNLLPHFDAADMYGWVIVGEGQSDQ